MYTLYHSKKISDLLNILKDILFAFLILITVTLPASLWLIKYNYISKESLISNLISIIGIPIGTVTNDLSKWGATGDFFGGILNPLISLFGMLFLIKTYKVTKSQFNNQLKEQETSIYNTEKQIFESTFFSMLDHLTTLESKINFDDTIEHIELEFFQVGSPYGKTHHGLEYAKYFIQSTPHLNEYFIFLYRTLKYIDSRIPEKKEEHPYKYFFNDYKNDTERMFYSGHIRALLNSSKLKLLAINCSTTDKKPNYEEYKKLITYFSMLEHLPMVNRRKYTKNNLIEALYDNFYLKIWGKNIYIQDFLQIRERNRLHESNKN